jgi:thiamine biosynthesis protein ThiI
MNIQEILLRYHEIALKGDNRRWFEDRLAINCRKLIQRGQGKDCPFDARRIHGRIVLKTDWNSQTEDTLKKRVFGLSNFSPMVRVKTEKEAIRDKAIEQFQLHVSQFGLPKSFRVLARRSDKALPETSAEIERYLGSAVHAIYTDLKTDLSNPDYTLGIEIRFKDSFIWSERYQGLGGLPVGTNAPVLTLISGGLDSPVAAIQVLKRGSASSFIHFYGTPFVGEEVLEKIHDLVRIVNRYQPDPQPLHIIPFGKIQEKIALVTDAKMRTLLYRRMMIRIANQLAYRIKAKALITGESLGQVASQTVENLGSIDSVTELPILRPLIAFDKDEIIDLAKKWGSYETSIRPATDCCTLFADRHPILRSNPLVIEEQEKKFSIPDLIQEALDGILVQSSG